MNVTKAGSDGVKVRVGPKEVKETLASTATFFSLVYGIVLILSMSYNVGYFKYINPQIVNLMSLGDYLDDTIHNIWLFLVAAILFFSSAAGFIKRRIGDQNKNEIIFGFIALIASGSFLLKGLSYGKFSIVFKIFLSDPELIVLFSIVLITIFSLLIFLIYRLSYKVAKHGLPLYSVSLVPMFVFFSLVLTPYLAGMLHGYVESMYLTKSDYKIQSVTINTTTQVINEAFIIDKLSTGLILRHFGDEQNSAVKVIFLPWSQVQTIEYKQITKQALRT